MSLVTRTGPVPYFRDVAKKLVLFRDILILDGSSILKREYQDSIRNHWYRTGATLFSLRERTVSEGGGIKRYELSPTATSPKGAPYYLFGEYGTGREGSASGRPAPRGYVYGRQRGMEARRYTRLATQAAAPQVAEMARDRARDFARNMTT